MNKFGLTEEQITENLKHSRLVFPWDKNLRIVVDANLLCSWPQGLRRIPEMQPEDLE